ncbi:hypothetical protein [Actinoplanes sp. URMC 104]|uniref:hypothetical protein n=1 Tax=Actinoplanes sp. URMC 104 TaxID=3423409 RepID=UPI003F1CF553
MRTRTTIRAVVAAAAVLTALLSAGCSQKVTAGPARTTPAAATSEAPASLCKDAPVDGCRQINVAGRAYRYYLSGQTSTGDALLVDVGGPGISLSSVLGPGYQQQFRTDIGAFADGKALLLIEEPWVDGVTDPACQASSKQFYTAVRQNWTTGTAQPTALQCPWGQGRYGWNRDTYRAVLTEIRSQERLARIDMAALSFGAVRYSYVDDLIGTAVLVRPAAAPGTANQTVVTARADQLWTSLAAQCSGCRTVTQAKTRAGQLIDRYVAKATPVSQRSVPVTGFDVASALVTAAINPAAPLGWKPAAATVDDQKAGDLSDALWMRIGEYDVSPAFVAYTDEYCQAYPGVPGTADHDPIHRVLAAATPCQGRHASVHRPKPVVCVIAGAKDMSAPGTLAATWPVGSTGRRVTTQNPRHWFSDMSRCGKVGQP